MRRLSPPASRVPGGMALRCALAVVTTLLACSPLPTPDAGVPDAGTFDAGTDGGGNPQTGYAHAGCDDAGTDYCPRDLVFHCALDSIERRHRACQSAADCVLVSPENCLGHWVCRPAAVNDAGVSSFLAEANAEISRYCDGALCRGGPSCAFTYVSADCVSGQCVARREDGGL